ncbi:MAG TPA: HAD family hydrolase, partial [Cyanobacteria bacterium UBA11049]|nr:HAD family hydrolase [Cyanobacteria bacterium UBA11049]
MPFVPLSNLVTSNLFKNIRLIATDMDGTLTRKGKFTVELIQAFEDLALA